MCPDPSILSAYRDGEVPSPWADRIAAHAASCPECARKLESYGKLSSGLALSPSADSVERARARVAERLASSMAAAPRTRRGPWHRYLVLPLPLALAAALVAAAVPAIGLLGRLSPRRGAAVASETPGPAGIARPISVPGTADSAPSGDFSDFASLLDYLNGQEGYIRITVDIPPNRKIAPGGPAEIRKVSVPPAEGGR
jgi:anti-sigma factor RsiW